VRYGKLSDPYHLEREGSIGLPFPDTYYKIVAPAQPSEQPYGVEGEICISGPSVMMEYIDSGRNGLHSARHGTAGLASHGRLGRNGRGRLVYFRQRIKRMIVSSGYSLSSQLENVIDAHEAVQMSCVIGVPDPYKKQKSSVRHAAPGREGIP
jgi:long-chain acyl-CoA synthetase